MNWAEWTEKHRGFVNGLLWFAAAVLALAALAFTDPGSSAPLVGTLDTQAGPVAFQFARSGTMGSGLPVILVSPVPSGVSGNVRYRLAGSNSAWKTMPLTAQTFEFPGQGGKRSVVGVGALLPSPVERGATYEYFVEVSDVYATPFSATGTKPISARFGLAMPWWLALIGWLAAFSAMLFAARSVLEALRADGEWEWMLWATVAALLISTFVVQPLLGLYEYRSVWNGIGWASAKVLLEIAVWLVAAWLNTRERNRASVFAAGAVTLLVTVVPQSLFGSGYRFYGDSG